MGLAIIVNRAVKGVVGLALWGLPAWASTGAPGAGGPITFVSWPLSDLPGWTCSEPNVSRSPLAEEVRDRLGARVCVDKSGLHVAQFIADTSDAARLFTPDEFLRMSAEAPWPVEKGSIRMLVSKRWPGLAVAVAGLDGGYVRHVTRGDGVRVGLKGTGTVPTAAVWVQIPGAFRDARAGVVRQHVLALLGRTALPEAKAPESYGMNPGAREERLVALDAALKTWAGSLAVRTESVTILGEAQYALARAEVVAAAQAPPPSPPPPPFDSIVIQPLAPGPDCGLVWRIVPEVARRAGFAFHIEVDGERVGTSPGSQSWFQFPEGKSPCTRVGTHKVEVLAAEEGAASHFARAEVGVVGERQPPVLAAPFLLVGPKDLPWLVVKRPEEWAPDVVLEVQRAGSAAWNTLASGGEHGGQLVFRISTKLKPGVATGSPLLVRSRLGIKEGQPVEARWLTK